MGRCFGHFRVSFSEQFDRLVLESASPHDVCPWMSFGPLSSRVPGHVAHSSPLKVFQTHQMRPMIYYIYTHTYTHTHDNELHCQQGRVPPPPLDETQPRTQHLTAPSSSVSRSCFKAQESSQPEKVHQVLS